ncbi:MAG: hypothetical protein K6F90_01340 [Lachnospiraceae bacterium]|nr:hypothetical protein [Lachnospiraceae bacterium]
MSEKNLKELTSIEELKMEAKGRGIHLSDADLESVIGGSGTDFPPVDFPPVGYKRPNCPKCGSSDVSIVFVFDALVILKCNKCGHVYYDWLD